VIPKIQGWFDPLKSNQLYSDDDPNSGRVFYDETLREVLLGDKRAEMLLEKVMKEVLQAEMTEHLGAEPGKHTDDRRGYRNGSYERELTTRIGSLKLELSYDRDGTFKPSCLSVISGRRKRW